MSTTITAAFVADYEAAVHHLFQRMGGVLRKSVRTKDGVVGPLLPPDMEPPIDLRWPEYINTPRGREWWIPPIKKD